MRQPSIELGLSARTIRLLCLCAFEVLGMNDRIRCLDYNDKNAKKSAMRRIV